MDYLPKQTVSEALRSATNGRSYIVHVDGVKKMHAVGYVTKYLTKDVTTDKRGMREELREMIVHRLDEHGHLVHECSLQTVQVVSKARRIRYTRHFFPASTAELRLRLFSQLGDVSEIAIDQAASPDVEEVASLESDDQSGDSEQEVKRSAWVLYEQEPFSSDIQDYRARRQTALLESLAALQAGKSMYSRRVVSIWAYQRGLARTGRGDGKPLQGKEQR